MRVQLRPFVRALLSAAAVLALAARGAMAQQGTITGQVMDRATQRPIASAQVHIVGTTRGTLTGDDGRYRLTGVPAGRTEIRALRIGYAAQSQVVDVAAGQPATADFALAQTATTLDVVTVTASGETQRKRETGNSVAVVSLDSIPKAANPTFSDVLTSRVAGVTVQQSGGTTGTSSRIRIRGSNSVSLNNDPLIIIDGVRVNNGSQSTTIQVGGQEPSRFDDLDPDQIENVEVIKGPAAAALYGTAAANGVVQITTKHGRPGRPRWNVFAEGGLIDKPTAFPANFRQVGVALDPLGNPTTQRVGNCNLYFQGLGSCIPKADSLLSFNPLVQHSPFIQGNRSKVGASVSGGTDAATYFLAGDFDREQGVYEINTRRRINLRGNVHAQIGNKFDVGVFTAYLQSRLRLPQNDNNILGIVPNGLLGGAVDDPNRHGYLAITPDQSFNIDTRQDLDRFTGSTNATWRPLGWLSFVGTAGIDFNSRWDHEITPANKVPFADLPEGNATSNPYSIWFYTANLGGTATYKLTSRLQGSSSAGVQYYDQLTHGTQAFGRGLVASTGSLHGTATGFAVDQTNPEIVTVGAYAQEQLAWRDKVYLSAALRGDDNSAFGKDFGLIYYPAVSGSWVVSEEPFFPRFSWLSQLRLRSAFGQSGQAPGFRQATSFFVPTAIKRDGTDQPAVQFIDSVGNPNLSPERSSEFEGGLDAGLFENRVGLELTYYHKSTRDAIVSKNLPPSTGAEVQLVNLGRVVNKGWEASVDANVFRTDRFGFDLRVSGDHNNNKLVTLGADTTPIIFGLGGASQRHAQGFPLGGYWQRPFTFQDKNGDGILQTADCPDGPNCEVQLGANDVYLGQPFPTNEFSFNGNLTLFKIFRLGALLDRRSGFKLYNSTEAFRCASFFNCEDIQKPGSPLGLQARAIASLMGSDAGYIEDASFWKLREVSITATAPRSWMRRLNATSVSLTVAGRNLHTWTKYTGLDPEINFTGSTNFTTADFLSQPPIRFWTARVDVVF